jgi:hypothetical protein
MKTGIVILVVWVACSIGALVAIGSSAENPTVVARTQSDAGGVATSLPGWADSGYALDAD